MSVFCLHFGEVGRPVDTLRRIALYPSLIAPIIMTAITQNRVGYCHLVADNCGMFVQFCTSQLVECGTFWPHAIAMLCSKGFDLLPKLYECSKHGNWIPHNEVCLCVASMDDDPSPCHQVQWNPSNPDPWIANTPLLWTRANGTKWSTMLCHSTSSIPEMRTPQ